MNILVGEDNDGSARVKTSHKLSFSTLALGAGWEVRAAVGGLKSRRRLWCDVCYDEGDNEGREHEAQ